uniref:Uncharacterized protein n=1 Tax=Molossus molossus TaxID=27622 RepID=A0A7J8DTH3_MOLMO|nr:hypothetical protein HJG59_009129 [Molossus molossus]
MLEQRRRDAYTLLCLPMNPLSDAGENPAVYSCWHLRAFSNLFDFQSVNLVPLFTMALKRRENFWKFIEAERKYCKKAPLTSWPRTIPRDGQTRQWRQPVSSASSSRHRLGHLLQCCNITLEVTESSAAKPLQCSVCVVRLGHLDPTKPYGVHTPPYLEHLQEMVYSHGYDVHLCLPALTLLSPSFLP